MNQITPYSIRLEEIFWGGLLLAVTMAIHGTGMLLTVRTTNSFKRRFGKAPGLLTAIGLLVLASWLILVVHLLEVAVWARFLWFVGALPNVSVAYYFSLLQYTTVGSQYNLPLHWRLLEGMIAIAGLMTFAWSTGVLFALGQEFQEQQLQRAEGRGQPGQPPDDPESSTSG